MQSNDLLHPQSSDSFRLAAIVESSFDAIISKDLNSVVMTWNAAARRMFGFSAEEIVGRSILTLIPDELRGEEADIIARIRRGERIESFETLRLRKDGTQVEVSLTVSPIRNSDGAIIGASQIARDITQAREAERRIRLLMREVNHRVKNQFAVILSIIRETNSRSRTPADFEARVRERIMALSRSHDLLVSSNWSGAKLLDLAQEHMSIFGREDQVTISGPMIVLQPNAVQHLGMALHELGTNAAKYGALTNSSGRIHISWQIVTDEAGKARFTLTWNETPASPGRSAVMEDPHRGFGSVVLERVVPFALEGTSMLQRDQHTVRWSLNAPIDQLTFAKSIPAAEDAPPQVLA